MEKVSKYVKEKTTKGRWHTNFLIREEETDYTIGETNNPKGGCGLFEFYNWVNAKNRSDWKEILEFMQDTLVTPEQKANSYSTYDCGAYLIQVGQDYYTTELCNALNELKVEYIEYTNPRHGAGYLQRSYFLKK